MKKKILGICIVVLMLVALVSGCTEESSNNNGGSADTKTLTMTGEEMSNDMTLDLSENGMIIGYNSLDEGDTLIIEDSISKIEYNSTNDWTKITFETGDASSSMGITSVFFYIQGDQTSSYQVDEQVKITNAIKHVQFTYQGASYNIELLEDQWESEEYFTSHIMTGNYLKPLPTTAIEKV